MKESYDIQIQSQNSAYSKSLIDLYFISTQIRNRNNYIFAT
jgi:hypothetical protein